MLTLGTGHVCWLVGLLSPAIVFVGCAWIVISKPEPSDSFVEGHRS